MGITNYVQYSQGDRDYLVRGKGVVDTADGTVLIGSVAAGNVMVTSSPPPAAFSTRIAPPCRVATRCAIARPSPLPPESRSRDSETRKNGSQICAMDSSGTPGPWSRMEILAEECAPSGTSCKLVSMEVCAGTWRTALRTTFSMQLRSRAASPITLHPTAREITTFFCCGAPSKFASCTTLCMSGRSSMV